MAGASVIDIFVVAALERIIAVEHLAGWPELSAWKVVPVRQKASAIRAVDHSGESVLRFSSLGPLESAPSSLLRSVPEILIDDRLVRVREEQPLIFRGLSPFLAPEILSHRFTENGMSEVFLAGKYSANGCLVPYVRIVIAVIPGITRLMPFEI